MPQGDAEKELDTVPHVLGDTDSTGVTEPDALVAQLLELVPEEANELDAVDELIGDEVSVPDPDSDTEPVPQNDAVWVTDAVPHALAKNDDDAINEADGLTDPVPQVVADALTDVDTVSEVDDVAEIVGDKVGATEAA